jgi:hypothetical protein
MAGSRTGTSTIIKLAERICKMVAVFGAADLAARTTPEFAAAVAALVLACRAFNALLPLHGELAGPLPAHPD